MLSSVTAIFSVFAVLTLLATIFQIWRGPQPAELLNLSWIPAACAAYGAAFTVIARTPRFAISEEVIS
jgi:hypothetical protein